MVICHHENGYDLIADNPERLKQIIAEMALEQSRYVQENDLLRERIRLLYAKLFGKRAKSMLPTAKIHNCRCLICRNGGDRA
jgi:hypothetical protein